VDVQSVPRFTLLEHYGSQVYQKRKPSALAFMGSLCNATTPLPSKKCSVLLTYTQTDKRG
ncbi:hypothetical protein, partial [Comamonas aquatica]|uniref:hypothetical protein n=1 Tax=Comamonas aquatica TaxID=225991 RepID=UPI0039196E37